MCFKIQPNNNKFFIATRDIICYKVARRKPINSIRFISSIYPCEYRVNFIMPKVSFGRRGTEIGEGYHSYFNLRKTCLRKHTRKSIGKFIIPKGSRYYINDRRKEYVSNQIIFKGWL
jgi:hypothetical protein